MTANAIENEKDANGYVIHMAGTSQIAVRNVFGEGVYLNFLVSLSSLIWMHALWLV